MIRPIKADELKKLVDGGLEDPQLPGGRVHVFDLRDADAFLAGHVPGARHLPHENHYPIRWIPQDCHTQEHVVLIDDSGSSKDRARHVAHELAHRWFRNVRYLVGGYPSWTEAGHPAETGGPVGGGSASFEGASDEVQNSSKVPWATPQDKVEH